jgi:hypothetical protein
MGFNKSTREMTKSNQSSLDIADHLGRGEYDWCPEAETRLKEQHNRIKELEKLVNQRFDDGKRLGIIETENRLLKAKTLTDAEIRTIQDMCHLKNVGYNTFIMRFARAILRKAQEK